MINILKKDIHIKHLPVRRVGTCGSEVCRAESSRSPAAASSETLEADGCPSAETCAYWRPAGIKVWRTLKDCISAVHTIQPHIWPSAIISTFYWPLKIRLNQIDLWLDFTYLFHFKCCLYHIKSNGIYITKYQKTHLS